MSYSQIKKDLEVLSETLRKIDCSILALLLNFKDQTSTKISQKQILEEINNEEEISAKYLASRLLRLNKMGFINRERDNIAYVYWTTPSLIKAAFFKTVTSLPLLSSKEEDKAWSVKKLEISERLGVQSVNLYPCVEGYANLDIVDSIRSNTNYHDIFVFSLTSKPPPTNYTNTFLQIYKNKLLKGQTFRIRRIISKVALKPDSYYVQYYKEEISYIKKIIQKYNLNSPEQTNFTYEIGVIDVKRITQGEIIQFRNPMSFFGVSGLNTEEGIIGYFTYSLREYLMNQNTHFLRSKFTFLFISDMFENLWLLTKKVRKDSLNEDFIFILEDHAAEKNTGQKSYSLLESG
ncbi:MAG: hypothetical protein ACTSRK_18435 [Promethearchaeota archaeon]